jgi:ribonuclease Z
VLVIVIFLGTGSGAPTTKRNVSAIALWFIQRGKWWLFDCGEGTQHQLQRTPLRLSGLEKVFLTHLHGDHLFGLIGLLASRSLRGGALSPVQLYGPPGLAQYVEAVMSVSPVHLQYPLSIQTVEAGKVFEDDTLEVSCAAVSHRIPAFAYALTEKPTAGAFRSTLAKEAGIPPGPLYGRLKRGETIRLANGRVFRGEDFVGPAQPGRKIVFSGDTAPCEALISLARGADVLIHEATYAQKHLELAKRSAHSTAAGAAGIAREAQVRRLILTHFSPRYDDPEADVTLETLLSEARDVFPDTWLAEDFARFEVKRRRLTSS